MPPPASGCFKLNFDGVARHGLAGKGGFIRTHNRALVVAYMGNLNGHTRNKIEAMALSWGVHFTLSMGIMTMNIEGDSKLIIDVVKGKNRLNWLIEGIIRDIIRLISRLDSFYVMHIYREGNRVVDAIVAL